MDDKKRVEEINKLLPYVDAKIYWKEEENDWTSKLWEDLCKAGWRVVESEEDSKPVIVVQDELGLKIFSSKDKISMLRFLVNILM